MEEIEFSRWLFEGRLRQGKNVLPDGLNWLCYLTGSSKSHRENSISFIFFESPHQVDMKAVVKSSKHFFGYFNTLETHSVLSNTNYVPLLNNTPLALPPPTHSSSLLESCHDDLWKRRKSFAFNFQPKLQG